MRVGIAGVTGYSGEELLRLLLPHPQVDVTYVAGSERFKRRVPIAELYADLPASTSLTCGALDVHAMATACDICLLALPHGQAMRIVPDLLAQGKRVIDLSGDFRLRDAAAYERWYGCTHTAPELLGESVYGLTEYVREQVPVARLVANPGCYATSTLLATLPLAQSQLLHGTVIVDAKSGYSGAGRETARKFQQQESGNLRAYKAMDQHQHVAEITQMITATTQTQAKLLFTPHIVPAERGLLSAVYVSLDGKTTDTDIRDVFHAAYTKEPFVRVMETGLPGFDDVRHTSACQIGLQMTKEILLVVSVLDNLRKGAASQAIQNLNLMCGFDETTGLL